MWLHMYNGALLAAIVSAVLPQTVHATTLCTVCQDGSSIRHPEAFVEETEQTCAELAEEASYYSDPASCRYYHRYGNECGCNNKPPPDTLCRLCQDGSPIPDPSLWPDGYDGNCGALQIDAAWNLWSTFDADEDTKGKEASTCDYYHLAGTHCGCPDNVPPADGCQLCLDGSPPLIPDKAVTPGNAAEATCEAFSFYTQFMHTQGTEDCTKHQSVVGSYCGCSSTPSSQRVCDYCPPGLVTREGIVPKVDFKAGNRLFYFRDAACIKVAMLAEEFDFPCDVVPDAFVESCCEPATGLLEPEVFVQEEVKLGSKPQKHSVAGAKGMQHLDGETSHKREAGMQSSGSNEKYDTSLPTTVNWDDFVFLSTSAASSNFLEMRSKHSFTLIFTVLTVGWHFVFA
ncbi:expressed unknown protein [Seminavis robusta]|uniref:Uncharacterized protein n=1 Tax=Seminavis robusta TaxID=568900 RepID=A0A9N8HFR9_9STRA|nr:expressed unknown protein [Seminavis robusta]|eukprot:Sro447_g145020.1 n/a (399) ;mRNA; r:62538-63734